MQTARNRERDAITRKINAEIQTALRDIGASEDEVRRIPDMSVDELYELQNRLGADPYLQAYVGSWGDTQPDHEILDLLRKWNAETKETQI
jgi:hypothetical protein